MDGKTRPIAFKCILERIHLSTCLLNAWQDVLSDHVRVGVVPKERSTRDLRWYSLLRCGLHSKMRRKAHVASPAVDESESCAVE